MCIKFVIKTSLYYDVRSEKHQIIQINYLNCFEAVFTIYL
jgi:hypothetical protein